MAKKKRRGKRKSKSQHRQSEFRDPVESHDEQELVKGDEEKGEGEKKEKK